MKHQHFVMNETTHSAKFSYGGTDNGQRILLGRLIHSVVSARRMLNRRFTQWSTGPGAKSYEQKSSQCRKNID